MKRFIDRLPLLLFILTLLSLALMIAVRITAAGTKLLSTNSSAGRLIAAYYHPSVVVFTILLVLYMAVIFTVRLKQYHRKKREQAENEAFTPGEVEYPPGPLMSVEQIEAKESDPETLIRTETENEEITEDGGTTAETAEDLAVEADIIPEAETTENTEAATESVDDQGADDQD